MTLFFPNEEEVPSSNLGTGLRLKGIGGYPVSQEFLGSEALPHYFSGKHNTGM